MYSSVYRNSVAPEILLKNQDFKIRINGPYYSYRDPITGRREFVFDEEIQQDLDEGVSVPKAIQRYLSRKYAKPKASYQPSRNGGSMRQQMRATLPSQETTLLSPGYQPPKKRHYPRVFTVEDDTIRAMESRENSANETRNSVLNEWIYENEEFEDNYPRRMTYNQLSHWQVRHFSVFFLLYCALSFGCR